MFTETAWNGAHHRLYTKPPERKILLIWLVIGAVALVALILLLCSLSNDIDVLHYEECTGCTFDENFASCENLDLLSVPPCLPSSLLELRMYGNFLRKLVWARPGQFSKLQYLDLALNKLTKVPEDSFLHMPELTHLLLDANNLVSLPDGVFRNNIQLTYLSLQQNNLRFLNLEMFEPLTRLQYLKLSGNKIARMDGARGFYNNRQLIFLDLASNLLRSLGNLCLVPETESSVYLEDNPWLCDVDAFRFVVSAGDLGIRIDDHPVCSDPPKARGVSLLKINSSESIQSASSDNHTI